jgi:hypothetical protein
MVGSRRQGFDNPTFGNGAAVARVDHGLQLAAERGQISELPVHLAQMPVGDAVDTGAVAGPVIRQTQQRPHLIEREAQIARAPDERQAAKLSRAIGAVVARAAGGRWQQADALVISHRLDLGVRRLAEIADRQRHALDPVVATAPTWVVALMIAR